MTPSDTLVELNERGDDLAPEILPDAAVLSLSASAQTLINLFSRAAHVTPVKEVIPGTSLARLEGVAGGPASLPHARITATDGEQTISVVTDEIRLRVPGEVLLSPKKMLDILKLAPEANVDLTVSGGVAVVRSGRARWSLSVPGEALFHDLGMLVDVESFKMHPVPVDSFRQSLKVARIAASDTNARISLMQIQVTAGELISCDGGRLHKIAVDGMPTEVDTTIPVRTADELLRALPGATTLLLGHDERHLVFRVDDDTIVAQRMLLPFPDMRSMVMEPKLSNTYLLGVSREELERAVRRVRVNADPDYAVVTLSIVKGARSAQDRILEVRGRDRLGNSAQEAVECSWEGGPVTMAFNHHHLVELLESCTSNHLTLKLGPDTKTIKHPMLVEDDDLTGIVQQVTQHW